MGRLVQGTFNSIHTTFQEYTCIHHVRLRRVRQGRLARAGARVHLRLRGALRRRGARGPRRGERAEGRA